MNALSFRNASIRNKLILVITPLILLISLFVFFFFPAQQNKTLIEEYEARMTTVTDMVALGCGIGLGSGELMALKSVFDWAKEDSNLVYIVVLKPDGSKLSQYPKDLELDYAALLDAGQYIDDENVAHFTHSIAYNGQEYGNILLGSSTEILNTKLHMVRATVAVIALIMLAIGIAISVLLGNVFRRQLTTLVDVAEAIKNGDYNRKIENPAEDEIGVLSLSINEMARSLTENQNHAASTQQMIDNVVEEINATSQRQVSGDLDARANAGSATGKYLEMVEGFNGTLDAIINPIHETIQILERYAEGDLEKTMRDLAGKQIALTEAINTIGVNLRNLIEEGVSLSLSAGEGELEARADVDKFKGGYRDIIAGMNKTLDSVTAPIKEASEFLQKMAEGDLSGEITSDYKGDHAIIKDSLNSTLDALNDILSNVLRAIGEVRSGSVQVSDSSQSLSQGATEQASSLEEISASMSEVSSQSKTNADNANEADRLAKEAKLAADNGNEQMKQMLGAMGEISNSSTEIGKIIKAIDEIAFQTNLLALNAAVEAARAGVHGKGFAVVAEEVRNLAQRSAKAAQETTELIEGSISKVEIGTQIADNTASSLEEIIGSISRANDLVGEIAVASTEQRGAIDQITNALTQIDHITQSNTASAEQSAAAAQELSGQGEQLLDMIQQFTLRQQAGSIGSSTRRPIGSNVSSQDHEPRKIAGARFETEINPDDLISLDDDF